MISVILVVYNGIGYIEEAVRHLLDQPGDCCEIVVVDGSSTDGTREVLMQYRDRLGAFISEPDKGIYDAMNKGVRLAKGDFLYFIGADDRLMVNLREVLPFLRDHHTVYYGDVLLKQEGKPYAGRFTTARLIRKNICHQSIFYPRAVFEKYSYDTTYRTMADYLFNIILWGDKTFRFEYIPLTIASYNQEGISSSFTERKFSFHVVKAIYRHLGWKYLFLKFFNPVLHLLEK